MQIVFQALAKKVIVTPNNYHVPTTIQAESTLRGTLAFLFVVKLLKQWDPKELEFLYTIYTGDWKSRSLVSPEGPFSSWEKLYTVLTT